MERQAMMTHASWAHGTAQRMYGDRREDEDRKHGAVSSDSVTEEGEEMDSGGAASSAKRRRVVPLPSRPRARRHNAKPRKATYLLQKQERDHLVEQVRLLEARLDLLQMRSGLPTTEDKKSLVAKRTANHELEEVIHAPLLGLARCNAIIGSEMRSLAVNPLSTFIHLPASLPDRQAVLLALKDTKIRRARDLTIDRLSANDPFKPYRNEERFIGDDGLFHCNTFDIEQFEGLTSGRQVFDALLYFFANIEISVTDYLGQFTLREDANENDRTVWNHRIVTEGPIDSMEELNTVGFAHYTDCYAPLNDSPLGIIASDTVDVDDLYPYKPQERTRKDIQAAMSITEHMKPGTSERIVVLKRLTFITQHKPAFPVSLSVVKSLEDNALRWVSLMTKFLQEYVKTVGQPVPRNRSV